MALSVGTGALITEKAATVAVDSTTAAGPVDSRAAADTVDSTAAGATGAAVMAGLAAVAGGCAGVSTAKTIGSAARARQKTKNAQRARRTITAFLYSRYGKPDTDDYPYCSS
jgi:hypothetical protein